MLEELFPGFTAADVRAGSLTSDGLGAVRVMLGNYPPIDPAGFDAFAASLPFPDIAQTIGGAEPLEDPVGFRFPASVRHRYERLREFPHGLLVLGDAISSFNPIHGQGMTVAANQALALRRLLARNTAPSPHQYFQLIAKTVRKRDNAERRGAGRCRLVQLLDPACRVDSPQVRARAVDRLVRVHA